MKIHYNFSFSFYACSCFNELKMENTLYLFGSFLFSKIRGLISV